MKIIQRYRLGLTLLSTLLATVFTAPLGGQEFNYRRITMSGRDAFGSPGSEFERFLGVQVDPLDRVIFSALLSGPTIDESNDFGIFLEGPIAFEGQSIGSPLRGIQFNELDSNFLVSPEIAILTTLAGPDVNQVNDQAILTRSSPFSSSFSVVARTGDVAPDTEPGTLFSDLSIPGISGRDIVFQADLTGPSVTPANSQVIHDGDDVIVRTGDRAQSTPTDVVFQSLGAPTKPGVFEATLVGPGVTSANDDALYISETGATPEQIAREGDPIPGSEGARRYRAFGPVIDSVGEGFAFRATFGDLESPAEEEEGIFSGDRPRLVAATGNVAPGTSNDARFVSFSNPALNSRGDTSFVTVLSFGGDVIKQGIYVEPSGNSSLRLAVLSGTSLPGVDATIREFSGASLARNDGGQVAFTALLEGSGINSENDDALFATDRYGVPRLLAREGDAFDVDLRSAVQDLRIVRHINFFGDFPLLLDDRGTLTFELSFEDGESGIFQAETFGLEGDFDFDNRVDTDDIDFYSGNLGQPASFDPKLDLDNDGTITVADHDLLITQFVQTSAGVGSLVGDINLDRTVNILGDAFTLVANLNTNGQTGYSRGDLNADGEINVLGDAFRLVSNLGMSR